MDERVQFQSIISKYFILCMHNKQHNTVNFYLRSNTHSLTFELEMHKIGKFRNSNNCDGIHCAFEDNEYTIFMYNVYIYIYTSTCMNVSSHSHSITDFHSSDCRFNWRHCNTTFGSSTFYTLTLCCHTFEYYKCKRFEYYKCILQRSASV